MSPNHTRSTNRFPAPHRAPGVFDEWGLDDESVDPASAAREERRRQRSFDGWLAGRIRKQARHWRPR